MRWTARDIPDQGGRTAVVTGANTGLGYLTARELARRGAHVVLACRSEERGRAALERMRAEIPEGKLELRMLDLGNLAVVREFAAGLPGDRLDLLVNNAGLMAVPESRTADGFETHFGVNHLGHFALTGLLLDRLLATEGSRVVNLSSFAHAFGNIDINDLDTSRRYSRWTAYGRSKTANLLFTHGLAQRLKGRDPVVAAAHPGYSDTELQARGPELAGSQAWVRTWRAINAVAASSPELGAAPSLYAATAPGVAPDSFHGPRLAGLRGSPGPAWRAVWTRNDAVADALWDASVELTGVRYDALG